MGDLENKKCQLCPNYICQNSGVNIEANPLNLKIQDFLDNLKGVSKNMTDLLAPLEPSLATVSSDSSNLENKVKSALIESYESRISVSLTQQEDCNAIDDVVENSVDVDADTTAGEMNSREMTTIYSEALAGVTTLVTLQTSEDVITTTTSVGDELPLCSEVVTSPPRIGVGLLSKFGISPSTIAPVPCRDDGDSTTPISVQSTTTTTLTSSSTTSEQSGNSEGGLLSSLADKFGK